VIRAVLVLAAALSAVACGTRGAGAGGAVAKPAPVEIDWPDAGIAPSASDAGSASAGPLPSAPGHR